MQTHNIDPESILSRLNTRIYQSFQVDSIAQIAVEEMQTVTGSPAVGLMLLNRENQLMELAASVGMSGESGAPDKCRMKCEPIHSDVNPGKINVFSDIDTLTHLANDFKQEFCGQGCKALVSMPLSYDGEVLGVIHLSYRKQADIKSAEKSVLLTIGETIGYAIGIARQLELLEQEKRERKFAEQALKDIAMAVSDHTGTSYFISIVNQISETFAADFVLIGKIDENSEIPQISTVAVSQDGKITDNFTYNLRETPCENVLNGAPCLYPDEVWSQFPNDILLQQMQIHSYLGYPLYDKDNKPFGVLVALYKKPMSNPRILSDVMKIYAARTSAEMERMRVENALKQSDEHLRLALSAGHTGTWEWDTRSGKIHWSEGVESIFGLERGSFDGSYESYKNAIYPKDLEKLEKAMRNALAENKPYIVEHRIVWPDNTLHWVLGQGEVIRNASGQAIGMRGSVIDITDRILTEIELRESDERYRAFIANSSEGIWRADCIPTIDVGLTPAEIVQQFISNSFFSEANDILAFQFGFDSANKLLGKRFKEIVSHPSFANLIEKFVLSGFRLGDEEIYYRLGDNEERWVSISVIGIVEEGKLVRVWGTQRDITEKKAQIDALEFSATHDALTKLPNREYLHRAMEKWLSKQPKLALLLMDLDRFKEINDTLGHHAGDCLLKLIGPRIFSFLDSNDNLLIRLGGDEFAILMKNIETETQVINSVKKILYSLSLPFSVEATNVEIGASIGISFFPRHGDTTSSLLRCADVAMYTAKRKRLGFSIYSSDQDVHSPQRLTLMTELGHGIRNNQLVLHYQPKIDLQTNKMKGFEALVRWLHPEMGLIQPDQFIPLAELGELIKPLTYSVVEKAFQQWCEWRDQGYLMHLSINLSARNIVDEDCPHRLAELIVQYNVDPDYIEFEITETMMMNDPARGLDIIQKLSATGVQISIDDFGTGYSSLLQLKQFPLHALKIDRTFVMHMLENEQDSVIVRSTINLAHSLGLEVIAEGVENRETLIALKAAKCDFAQGFEISKPLPAEETHSWLQGFDLCYEEA